MNRMKWRKASVTVEAAVLIPMAIAILLFFVTAALYLHDINVSMAHMQEITAYGRMQLWQQEEGKIQEKAEEIQDKGKLGLMKGSVQVEVSGSRILASEENNPGILFQGWFSSLGWTLFPSVKAVDEERALNPVKIIRRCRLLESAGESIGENLGENVGE
jgi:hypothetical protein